MGWWRAARKTIGEGMAPLVDLAFPPRCPLCGAAIAAQNGLCASCWERLEFPGEPACATCGRPLESVAQAASAEGLLCGACLQEPPRHAGIAAGCVYNEASRALILAFKHGGKIALAPMLAGLIAARLGEPEGETVLIAPVPLHRWRLWQRGYNQSALLARELAQRGHGRLVVDLLKRRKATPSLAGKSRAQRRRILSGAITLNEKYHDEIKGRRVVLVDDVLTSGATSGACVAALLKAGAKAVRIACFARVLDEGSVRSLPEGEGAPDNASNKTPEARNQASGAT